MGHVLRKSSHRQVWLAFALSAISVLDFSGCNSPDTSKDIWLDTKGATLPAPNSSAGSASGTPAPAPSPSSAPSSGLTIASPAQNPYTTNTSSVTLSGACTTGRTVNLSGDQTGSASCAAASYSFTLNKSVDGTYVFNLSETDGSYVSPTLSFQWTRSTVGPAAPMITSPAASPYSSNTGSIAISGTCVDGNQITLSGDDSQNVICAGASFNFTVNKSSDGVYAFNFTQSDNLGNLSPQVTQVWVRDTVAPVAPAITTPSYSPYTSGDTNLKIIGSCETGATVAISGASSATTTCSASAFTINVSQSVDGTYNYSILQTDPAGNASPSTAFTWTRDTTIPATPVISSPVADPYYSNSSSLTLSGSCASGYTVTLGGSVSASEVTSPLSSLTQVCPVTNTYSFTIAKSADGSYPLTVIQTQTPGSTPDSAPDSMTWIRDTVAPSSPSITSPNSNPYTSSGSLALSGTCEANATVNLSGDDTQNVICSSGGAYTFNIAKSTDATYNFSVSQTDLAGNASGSVTQTWVRNSTVPSTPTITNPASNPYRSNGSSMLLSGACTTGNTVQLSGDVVASDVTSPSGSLTQACASSAYSFTIAKSVDGTYNFSVVQINPSLISSGAASLQWVRDTVAPVVTISSGPASTNIFANATFSFSSNESGSSLQCSLDGAAFSSCSSPTVYSAPANGSHTFQVKATDLAGNTSTVASQTWTQASYNAIALYHFDSSSGMLTDSGLYGSGYNNPLTNNGSASAGASAKFAQSVSLNGSSQYLSSNNTATQNLLTSKFTVEGFVKFATSMSNGQYMTLVSKMSNTATAQMGWEIGMYKQNSSTYKLYLVVSYNGTSVITPLKSSSVSFNTSAFHHFAVTYNNGGVAFYWDGGGKGTATATGGTAVFASTDALRIGKSNYNGSAYTPAMLNGIIDEVRLSQNLRYTGAYTVPSAAFTAD